MRKRLPRAKKWVVLLAAVVVIAAAGGGWALARPAASEAATPLTATATRGTIRQTVAATGTIEPAQRSDLSFAVSGTVTSVPVAVGDEVGKGATLATLANDELQSAVDTAQAGVDAAQDQVDAGASSSVALASAEAQLAAAQSTLSRAEAQLADARLTSPIAGTVAAVNVAAGDVVSGSSGSSSAAASGSPGSGSSGAGSSGAGAAGGGSSGSGSSGSGSASSGTAQFTVISTSSWVVDASVGAADLAQVKKGLQVEITPDGTTQKVFGTVSSVGVMASPGNTGSAVFPVVVKVTGTPSGLYAGGTVTAAIVVRELQNVLTVPTAALSGEGGATYVTVVKGGVQTRAKVGVGTVYGPSTQITSGLSEGQQVLVPQIRLSQGGGTNRQRTGQFPGGGQGGGQGLGGRRFSGGGGGFSGGGGQAPGGVAQ